MKIIRKIQPFFSDKRGVLSHLLENEKPITSALLITSKKGTIRANHYHIKDTHYVYVIKGSMEYYYKNSHAKNVELKKIIVTEGEIVKTPLMTPHAMKFRKDSIFLALTTEPRDQKKYEKDTVRIKLI